MFENATLKLTAWYLLIIMVISLLFSVLVYQSAISELGIRFEHMSRQIPNSSPLRLNSAWTLFQQEQMTAAAHNILVNLIYINLLVLAAGGVASYLMARKTLEPLKEAHETESRFVSDASHELRTPLAAMKTEIEVMLRDTGTSSEELRELLQSNLEEVNKLTQLSQTLLTLSKMEYEKLPRECIDIKQLTAEVTERYDKSRSRITIKQPRFPLQADGNLSSIEELVTILIDNALKYSPAKSPITIKLGRRINTISFDITNSGRGITQQDLPYIFDRFYRADNARNTRDGASFGLGLSLAKTIIELHDGDLSVSSAPGKYTTFSFTLPIYRASKIK